MMHSSQFNAHIPLTYSKTDQLMLRDHVGIGQIMFGTGV